MIINKGKLSIELEENINLLKEQIQQLRDLKKAILSSSVYKLLDGKTQMLEKKITKTLRSRQGHTNNVAYISIKTIETAYDLCASEEIAETEIFKLNKLRASLETEIVALSHDLGHTPFGHNGEAALNEYMQSITDEETIAKIIENRIKYFGKEYEEQQGHTKGFRGKLSFEHNEQSAIEFSKIAEQNKEYLDKLDIKRMAIGILSHSTSRVRKSPSDLYAQIVRIADKIDNWLTDYKELETYIRIEDDEVSLLKFKNLPVKVLLDEIIINMASEAIQKGKIYDDNDAIKEIRELRNKYDNAVHYIAEDGKWGLINGDNKEREQIIYIKLLEYYYKNPERIPTKSLAYTYPIKAENENQRVVSFDLTKGKEDTVIQQVIKYLSTFTNEKCYETYMRLVRERILKGVGYGIEPIKEEEIEERKKRQIQQQVAKIRSNDTYKDGEEHTDEECLAILQSRYKRFIENDLTDEARDAIEKNRKKHEQENAEDEILRKVVYEYDEKRKIARLNEINQKLIMQKNSGEETGISNPQEDEREI